MPSAVAAARALRRARLVNTSPATDVERYRRAA
jgi:hypothetical protein